MITEDWAALRADIKRDRDFYYEAIREYGEKPDGERREAIACGYVDAYDKVLGFMDEAELDASTGEYVPLDGPLGTITGTSRKVGREWCRLRPGSEGRLVNHGGHGETAWAWIDTREERE
jgi:hypothetical protein